MARSNSLASDFLSVIVAYRREGPNALRSAFHHLQNTLHKIAKGEPFSQYLMLKLLTMRTGKAVLADGQRSRGLDDEEMKRCEQTLPVLCGTQEPKSKTNKLRRNAQTNRRSWCQEDVVWFLHCIVFLLPCRMVGTVSPHPSLFIKIIVAFNSASTNTLSTQSFINPSQTPFHNSVFCSSVLTSWSAVSGVTRV